MARVVAFALCLACGIMPATGNEPIWIGPDVGAWNVPANWSTGAIPNFSTAARIDDEPARNARVESSSSATVGLLTIDAGDSLAVINSPFNVNSVFVLDGTIIVEGSGQFSGGLILEPGSELRLNGSNATASAPIFNEGNVHGGGRLNFASGTTGMTRYNESTYRADNPTVPLTLQLSNNANLENNGRLIATGGGRLQITGVSTFGNPFGIIGGRIEAHPGSIVSMHANTYVEDAILALINDEDPLTSLPSFQFVNAKLKDVTLEGNFKLSGATIAGTLRNPGELTHGSSHVPNNLDGEVVLNGGGTVNLQGLSSGGLFGGADRGSNRLINVDNVIRGHGELVVATDGFTNRHIVQADAGPNMEMWFYNGVSEQLLVNSGVMKAVSGGLLRLTGNNQLATMENFEGGDAGEIIAGENSTVALRLIHIKGGLLRAEGNDPATRGRFLAEPAVVFENMTTEGSFRFQAPAGQLSTITINERINNKGSITARFLFGLNVELAGGGEMIGEAGPFFTLGAGASIVNVDNFIHGSGSISSNFTNTRFTNRGTVRADGTITTSLQLQIVNRGRLEAGPGAQFDLPGIATVVNYEDGVDGVIHAADGGLVTFNRIDGGILSTEGSGVIRSFSAGFIKDVHNQGTLEVNFIEAQGTIVNGGLIKGGLRMTSPFVRFEGDGTWDAIGSTLQSGVLINGPEHTILGIGNFTASPSTVTVVLNEGTLRAKEGTVFNIFARSFENTGLVHAPAGRTLGIGSSLGRAENRGRLQVDGNMGFHAPPGLYNENGGMIDVQGNLTLEETVLRNRQGGSITGDGSILGPTTTTTPVIVNEGRIAPGSGIATLTIQGNFEQLAAGILNMEIAAGELPANDLLAVDGSANLAGKLQVTLTGDDPLALGDSFTLLTATEGVMGTFDQLVLPLLGEDLSWHIQYAGMDVRATVVEPMAGDFDRDGFVTAADFVAWRRNGGDQNAYQQWLANFGNSRSDVATLVATPEPTSSLLLLFGVAIIHFRRRPL